MNTNDFEMNSKFLFARHNVLVFTGKTKEFNEIETILKNTNFNDIFFVNELNSATEIVLKHRISLLIFDINTIEYTKHFKEILSGRYAKYFLLANNITNELFKYNFDDFIFEPSINKQKTILKLFYKNLCLIENEINIKYNNQKITEQQKNFDKIFDLLSKNSLITKTDINGKIIYANEIFQEISGYKKNEIIGKNHSIIRHEKTSNEDLKKIWLKISKKEVWSGILRNKTKYGQDYIVDTKIMPELDMDGNIISYLAVQYDITELVHKNELAKLLMDEQSSPILIGQIGKGIVNASKEFLNLFSFNNLETFTTKFNSILELAIDLENYDIEVIDLFKRNETITLKNIKLDTSFDTMKNFDIIQKKIITPFGSYYIITLNDITVSQQEVANAKNEAAVKSNFLATMSHEIRTPLNGMLPYVDLLLETGKFNNEQLDYITTIKQSSESLLRIINDILDFSKIESGKLEIENISFEPVKEFESVIELYIAKANEKNISLLTYIEPNLPNLIGDPLRIKQIINNLLSNAIKFTPEFGEIRFSVENNSKSNELVELHIYVKDNGKGITPEQQLNIFTPFSQADNSISRKFGGTGLGLSISNDLATLMGGNITLQSAAGYGSKFSLNLNLPIDKNNLNKRFETLNNQLIGIYSTDDNKFKCEIVLLCKYLKAMKFNYTRISNAEESDKCDVVFVLSSGDNYIPHFTEDFTKENKVITILGSTVENTNKFHSNAIIHMPINGSKIYDSIIDTDKINKQNESLLNYSNNNIDKYEAKVLVAEDNPTNQKLVKTLLAKHGIAVDIADNGKIALEKYINNHNLYNLVFLDIHMPIMDGLEAIKKIREFEKENKLKPISIIALTADAIKNHQQQYFDSGFTNFLAKPIEREKFENTLKKYLKSFAVHKCSLKNNLSNSTPNEDQNTLHKNSYDAKVKKICTNLELDEETVKILLDDFMSNWVDFELRLKDAVTTFNHDCIREVAHSLKGASGSLMLNDIYEKCKELEEIAKQKNNQNLSIYNDLLEELRKDMGV